MGPRVSPQRRRPRSRQRQPRPIGVDRHGTRRTSNRTRAPAPRVRRPCATPPVRDRPASSAGCRPAGVARPRRRMPAGRASPHRAGAPPTTPGTTAGRGRPPARTGRARPLVGKQVVTDPGGQLGHLGGIGDEHGIGVPQQGVAPGRRHAGDRPGHRPDRQVVLARRLGRGERPRAQVGLDDDGGPRQQGDDPVARQEPRPVRRTPRRHLADHRPVTRRPGRACPGAPWGRPGRRRRPSTATVGPSAASAARCAAESTP